MQKLSITQLKPVMIFLNNIFLFSHELTIWISHPSGQGHPRWLCGEESAQQCRRCRRCGFDPWVRKIPWNRKWQHTQLFLPGKSHGQRACRATVHGVPKSQTRLSDRAYTHRSSQQYSAYFVGESNGTPLQHSCLENPMDRGAWQAAVHGVTNNRTRLSNFTFTFHFHALEKKMATHSSVLAWRIPGMGQPGGLPSMGSHRVGHD